MSTPHYSMLPNNLRVNIPVIDGEHDELFAFLEGFKVYCFDISPMPQDRRSELFGILQRHFETEERLATEAGINFLDHADAHETMLETIAQTLNQMGSNNSDLYSLIRYIGYWFEIHILNYDITLARSLKANSQLIS